jgi:Mg-chelatase subunit ChlD
MSERPRTLNLSALMSPPSFNQLGILVLDGSHSMHEPTADGKTKTQAVDTAVRDIFARFKESRYAKNFSFAVVTFDEDAQMHTPITPAIALNKDGDYDPMKHHGGATNIATGLLEAKRIANEFLRDAPREEHPTVVIVLMSDGRDGDGGVGDPEETRRIAEEIKRNQAITICSTYFAGADRQDQQEQDQLKSLASNPVNNYKTVYDAESLRRFFYASLSSNTNIAVG